MEEPEVRSAPPIPSGSMYIGVTQTRMQYAVMRWALAIPFLTVNAALLALAYQIFDGSHGFRTLGAAGLALIGCGATYVWRRLTERTHNWVRFHTTRLSEMEEKQGTESGVRVFSHPEYLSKPDPTGQRDRSTFHKMLSRMIFGIMGLWASICLSCTFLGLHLLLERAW